ncbi:MAG: helix-turn-helix domain-containing protein [Gemmatimonadota bacterium]
MKITKVRANNRKRVVEVKAGRRAYDFPYAKLPVQPTRDDPVTEVVIDAELGGEGFTYQLRSGIEASVHVDSVREVAEDPLYLQELFLHRLTVEMRDGLAASGLGVREVARQLGTSPSQVYRLLDPLNHQKPIGQVLALLHLVDREVDVTIRPRQPAVVRDRDS